MSGESLDPFKLSGCSYFSSGFGKLRHEAKCGSFFSFSDGMYNLHRRCLERILAKCLELMKEDRNTNQFVTTASTIIYFS